MVDVDGVLVRGRPDDGRRWSTSLEEDLGLAVEALQRAFFAIHWDEVLTGRATLDDRLAPVLAAIAPHLTVNRLVDYWFRQDSRLDRDLLRQLERIRARGIGIHLATNQEHRRARYLMETVGLEKHVDGICHSAALGWRKPEPEFFQAAAARAGLPAADLLLIDDLAENIHAAAAAGWQTLHWTGDAAAAERLEAIMAS